MLYLNLQILTLKCVRNNADTCVLICYLKEDSYSTTTSYSVYDLCRHEN